MARNGASPEDAVYLSAAWTKENVSSRGPLGAFYRVWGDGRQMVKDDIFDYFGFSGLTASELKAKGYMTWAPVQEKGSWISEGDTPTFLNLLDNGLGAHEGGEDGGWGGRKRNEVAAFGAPPTGQAAGPQGPRPPADGNQPDFFPAAQRDFAARLKWSVTPRFADAITSRRLEPNVGQYGSERRCPIRTVMRWP